ncbi:hypothetical protein SAMN02745866_03682 [Alteromonadaceae bacterium Bs31]|nr:hypothetical protein SAMN02745866_03682 [Alteromonadaceae bacterium Bs31]
MHLAVPRGFKQKSAVSRQRYIDSKNCIRDGDSESS